MKLRRNEYCPIHRSRFCCGREQARKERRFQLGVQRIDDPHHARGYRELRSPAEMRKLLNRKVIDQDGKCAICQSTFTNYNEIVPDHIEPKGGFDTDGDREGWLGFLRAARDVFAAYGDIPFVHWHHYERVHIEQYIRRYGDPDGIADRVLGNLLDLLPITKSAIALPLPSYSLKVVEEYVGFKRTQDEYGGDWAMAQFILATETKDEAERNHLMGEILKYNEEDLAATWAVFDWLRGKGSCA